MASSTPFEAIVIGAGATGTMFAQGLRKNGIKVTVYEREDNETYKDRPREWGMTIHWGADFLKTCLDQELLDGLNEGVCCNPHFKESVTFFPMYNAQSGEKLFDMKGVDPRRVSRRKLRNYLSTGVDVQYGKTVNALSPGPGDLVTVHFTDGTTASANFVLGADGAHSTIRRLLVGEEKAVEKDVEVNMFNAACKFPREVALAQQALHPVFRLGYHPENFMVACSAQDINDLDKPEEWLFQNVLSWPGKPNPEDFPDQASRIAFWKSKADLVAEPFKTTIKNLPDDLIFPCDHITSWSPINWHTPELGNRVSLAGDAAHNIPPFRAQGLNNGLADSANLVVQLVKFLAGEQTLDDAVTNYEAEMFPRALGEMELSSKQAYTVHHWDVLMNAPAIKFGMEQYREEQAAKKEEEVVENLEKQD